MAHNEAASLPPDRKAGSPISPPIPPNALKFPRRKAMIQGVCGPRPPTRDARTMPDTHHAAGDARSDERRHFPRRHIPFSWVQLAEDNGGIVVDVSERGLSVQAVRGLSGSELPNIRVQIGKDQPCIETRARVAWVNSSNNAAGLEFVELADEARDQIKHLVSSEPKSNESEEPTASVNELKPTNESPALLSPEYAIPVPELETTEREFGTPDQPAIPKHTLEDEVPVEGVQQHSWRTNASTGAARTAGDDTLVAWSELEARVNRETKSRDRTGFTPRTNRLVGVAVIGILLLSALFFVGYHSHESKIINSDTAGTAMRPAEPSPDTSAGSTKREVAPTSPDASTGATSHTVVPPSTSAGPAYALQVVATTDKTAADALAAKLKRSYFPAFVYFRGTDPFYRVFVGPYSDSDSKLRMDELKAEGYASFRTPWNPSAAQPPRSTPSH
jgi:cell division septation protein DedD